ncbi:hypothetical protein NMG60_11026488 [Bertholletia excelsa]
MMGTKVTKKEAESKGQGLTDLVFSWSFADALNPDLYKFKVNQIPKTFSSTKDYMNSFIKPLIEETHAELLSGLKNVHRAPFRQIMAVELSKNHKPPKALYYNISLKGTKGEKDGTYEPEAGDLIALTEVRPKSPNDLNNPRRPFMVALVQGLKDGSSDYVPQTDELDKISILSSKIFVFNEERTKEQRDKKRETLFIVFLANMTTNIRIWAALKSKLEGSNMNIIQGVLRDSSAIGTDCSFCLTRQTKNPAVSVARDAISSFQLNDSQTQAILECVSTAECCHNNSVKLIWGPPGTGKTKTVASLLVALWKIKCRTLTCAPTNIAVLEVTRRLLSSIRAKLEYETYGLGDIVLFGNEERMKIGDNEGLYDVFLDYRVSVLADCLLSPLGWKSSVESMICLLKDPERMYRLHGGKSVDGGSVSNDDGDQEDEGDHDKDVGNRDINSNQNSEESEKRKIWRRAVEALKENKKKKGNKEPSQRKTQLKSDTKEDSDLHEDDKEKVKVKDKHDTHWTFEAFLMKRYRFIKSQLKFRITNLYTHLPTSSISLDMVKQMVRLVDLLDSIELLLRGVRPANKGLREVLSGFRCISEFSSAKIECLEILKSLREGLNLPNFIDDSAIRSFCLQQASLIFCTASSSFKLHTEGMRPIDLLVIDEAAQLKECESTIPLQLSGLRHAILIGDERQLPAMVQSKICEKVDFGRSLFERLVSLGHHKHLLNVQYRMHPSISFIPNKEFYDGKILDAPHVQETAYEKRFLQGNMYGPYSFINVARGREDFDEKRSCKNIVEVAVVAEIVAGLFRESVFSKQNVRIGCISPYKAQVSALQERLGKTYSTDEKGHFSVSVRSIDGFQGGEEDVIIISTVRCNPKGDVGFFASNQRVNVALTRARHCLWVVGNGDTLSKSRSVWANIVQDATVRGCFYDADNDRKLKEAVDRAYCLARLDSLPTTNTKWKVSLRSEFKESMEGIENVEVLKEVVSLLEKLCTGWRRPQSGRVLDIMGTASELLEVYNVKGRFSLIWSVDTTRENASEIQVIKVWDILPVWEIPKLVDRFHEVFRNYTTEKIIRCKCKKYEGFDIFPLNTVI